MNSIGLVLVGGGAKGAYQAGALTYLAEIGFEPQVIAGTSIGALNGAVLASHASFFQGVNALNQLWEDLGNAQIIKPNIGGIARNLSYVSKTTIPHFNEWIVDYLQGMGFLSDSHTIFDPEPIEYFLKNAINFEQIRQGLELWVTVFPALDIPGIDYDLLMVGLDIIRAKTGTQVHWLCAQDFYDNDTLFNLLLASAAIPLMFPQREVNGQFYVDGALVDNIPFGVLAAKGCTHGIVIHLDNGEIWNRHDFPEQTIIEIRPYKKINHSDIPIWGAMSSILDFSVDYIAELKYRGYKDAKRCLKPILQSFKLIGQQRQTNNSLVSSTFNLLNDSPL
ncbi:patatin-like phospholipase family protein [Crocosphaera sp. XPORK-15E]|uniref:patatin-like phospholipase family protein n=1 Tax=Crocosphaera sp. XPORK-15E TaxID=3110247 RepID=UPI002B1FEFCA|nr:patatin-like phospholipase family protein [Crocosphaera sp. XPORK-15E]MEA5536977.1 patatin-like phospholipase family protein [Crocosphaera sp. XPORK-15E]